MVTKVLARAREVIVLAPKRTLIVVAVLVGVVILYVLGKEKQDEKNAGSPGSAAPAASASACRVAITADVLNVRAEPNGTARIVGKFNRNAEADAEKVVQNGFRKLAEGRWVSDEFVKPLQGRDC